MKELEELWPEVLREAEKLAAGGGEIADYVRLRRANDEARRIGIDWLINTFANVATAANQRGFRINIELSNDENGLHQFKIEPATMRGALIRLTSGVRVLSVEAGFPRVPADGFVRGGGLAAGKITHFGISQANADLLLIRANNNLDAPFWTTVDRQNLRQPFAVSHLKQHFAVFLDQT